MNRQASGCHRKSTDRRSGIRRARFQHLADTFVAAPNVRYWHNADIELSGTCPLSTQSGHVTKAGKNSPLHFEIRHTEPPPTLLAALLT